MYVIETEVRIEVNLLLSSGTKIGVTSATIFLQTVNLFDFQSFYDGSNDDDDTSDCNGDGDDDGNSGGYDDDDGDDCDGGGDSDDDSDCGGDDNDDDDDDKDGDDKCGTDDHDVDNNKIIITILMQINTSLLLVITLVRFLHVYV